MYLTTIKIFILSLLQAIAEFLPISSTAHLLLANKFLQLELEDNGLFFVLLQLASMLALMVYYRKKIIAVVLGVFKDAKYRRFVFKLMLALVPTAFTGFIIYGKLKDFATSSSTMAVSLVVGGIVFLLVEKHYRCRRQEESIEDFGWKDFLLIGAWQSLAVVAGVSRSGATIIGALLAGFSRKMAVEFSFFLAMPTIFCASLVELYKNSSALSSYNLNASFVGMLLTFIIALPMVDVFIKYISSHNFKVFGYYRIVFGLLLLTLLVL